MGTLVSELWELVLAYVKQQTLVPLKSLGRFVGLGVAGGVLLAVGVSLWALAAVRALQAEFANNPHGQLSGDWSWVPYLGGVVLALALAGLAVSRIGKAGR